MNILDRLFLLAAEIVAIYMILGLIRRQRQGETKHPSNSYHLTAFSVLLISELLLTFFGWGILGLMGTGMANKMLAIFASLIPFSWATALVSKIYPRYEKVYLSTMVLGLVLISLSRFMDMPTFARIIYPVFHSTAGITVISLPFLAVKKGLMGRKFLWIAIGGALISLGGISLAFLASGKQLLFFSRPLVLSIMAPLLFLTTTSYMWGLSRGGEGAN